MKENKKKIVCIFIAAVLIIMISGCGNSAVNSRTGHAGALEDNQASNVTGNEINSGSGSEAINEGPTDEELLNDLLDKAKGEQQDPGDYPNVFEGLIDIKENAGGGSISFSMSDDGKKLTNVQITFTDIICSSTSGNMTSELTIGEQGLTLNGIYEMADNTFTIKPDETLELKGQLIDSTKAEGTIHYIVETSSAASADKKSYDLGTWNWSAVIKQ